MGVAAAAADTAAGAGAGADAAGSGPEPGPAALAASPGPWLVYDGGCPFCRQFAAWSELRGGIPGLGGLDGRADAELRQWLLRRGHRLSDGAVLLSEGRILQGAEAIQWICSRLQPSADLRRLLSTVLATPQRARQVYPLLLLARRLALAWRGLPLDPDQALPPPPGQGPPAL
ncbi:MAG: DCC1-like thiol-disulfide oxidoreductase family protein [Synechococcus sp.]|nr:DCC1-like thiol-disulfide oxidoreductase family protein [Synechococcus sp.]